MKSKLMILIACAFIFNATSVLSHHGRANYLYDNAITVEGKVVNFKWRNPHSYMEVQVTNYDNDTNIWLVEGGTITRLKRLGWQRDSIKAGDSVVVVGFPDKDPKKNIMLLERVVLGDGKILYSSANAPPTRSNIKQPSSDIEYNSLIKKPTVAPSQDFSGTWSRNRSNTEQTGYFMFLPPNNWSLTKLGKEQLAHFDERDNPGYDCIERGLPFFSLYPYYLLWTRYEDRIDIISQQSTLIRTLYLNQDTHPDDVEPSPVGHSIARFDDDGSLLVDTSGFSAVRWGLAPGVDSSDQKRIKERFTLSEDGLRMNYSIMLEDPVYLIEPVIFSGSDHKVADVPFETYICDLEAAQKILSPPLNES